MNEAARVLREQLRKAMSDSDMSQVEFAKAGDIRQGHVSGILSGNKRPGRKTLGAILLVFPNLRPYVVAVLTARGEKAA
jgi:predicted transcriptional regulator